MKWTVRLIGLFGATLFGLVLTLTYASPIHVERAARGFIQNQIERQLASELGGLREGRAGRAAEILAARNRGEMGQLRDWVANDLSAKVAASVARMQNLDCECRERLQRGLDVAVAVRFSNLERAEPQLRAIIEGRYGLIVADLLRDLRLFAAINLVAFLLVLVLSAARPARLPQLFVPALLLSAAALIAGGFYLFGQSWFFTILYADYAGWTYGLWLLLVFGLLCDVALLGARFTTWIVNRIASALGQAPFAC